MRDGGAALVAAANLVFRQMHAVRQHGASPDQSMMIVDVEVVLSLGKSSAVHSISRRFSEMCVCINTPGCSRHSVPAARVGQACCPGKARRDRIERTAAAVPARDQRLRVVVALLGGVAQIFRRIAVHQHLAGDDAHAAAFSLREQRIDGLGIHRAKHERRRRPVAQQLVAEHPRHRRGMRGILERHLGRVRVTVEPVQELLAIGGDHAGLHIVHVRVDESRGDQAALVVCDLRARAAERISAARPTCSMMPLRQTTTPSGSVASAFGPDRSGTGRPGTSRSCRAGPSRCRWLEFASFRVWIRPIMADALPDVAHGE